MIIVTDQNGVSAAMHVYPVGVACKTCGRRGTATIEAIKAKGSMQRLADRRWVCSRCTGADVELALFFSAAQVEAWSAGKSYADVWDLRLDGEDATKLPWSLYVNDPNPFRAGQPAETATPRVAVGVPTTAAHDKIFAIVGGDCGPDATPALPTY